MRCYLMRDGHIQSVEFLETGTDQDLVRQARAWFDRRKSEGRFDGFEVWDGTRRVFVYPERTVPPTPSVGGD